MGKGACFDSKMSHLLTRMISLIKDPDTKEFTTCDCFSMFGCLAEIMLAIFCRRNFVRTWMFPKLHDWL